MPKTNVYVKTHFLLILLILLSSACTNPPPTPKPLVPAFDHIILVVFENKEFDSVIGNPEMPVFNQLARDSTLLTQYYAVVHPSLPNYIAMIGGDTFGIDSNCEDCFIDEQSLPDLIEASGRTWRTYQEDMPSPCFLGNEYAYAQKHNPFIYFDPIRLNPERCQKGIVPFTQLPTDLEADALPNFVFITPDMCHSSHDCGLHEVDEFVEKLFAYLIPALDASGKSYLIVLTFEEGETNLSCCGLPAEAGGRVPTILYSPLAKSGIEDPTPYTHYSLLKTISIAWGLPLLGHANEDSHVVISVPWK